MSRVSENPNRLYKYDRELFIDLILEYDSPLALSKASGVNSSTIYSLIEDLNNTYMVGEETAIRLAKLRGVELERMFHIVKHISQHREGTEVSYLVLSEQILVGLKANIEKRLSVHFGKPFVNDIIKLVDDIIVEAAYLGVCAERDGSSQFICNKLQIRRKGE